MTTLNADILARRMFNTAAPEYNYERFTAPKPPKPRVLAINHEDLTNMANAALAMVREALLTPEAVEAGARGIAFVGMEELYPDQDETWRTADEEQKELFRREIRSGITAALNATGLEGSNE